MSNLLIVGSVALDNIETPFGKVNNVLGGSAVYASYTASFFSKVNIVGVVGTDFPKEYIEFFKSKNIDTKGLQIVEGKTFRWSGYYEYDMNVANTLFTHLNVFADFTPHIPPEYQSCEYVFLANINPDLQLFVLKQVKKPKLVLCDTMNYWITSQPEKVIEVIKSVDIVTLNDAEVRQLCQTPSIIKGAKNILNLGPHTVIIKKGENGAVMFHKDSYFAVPGYPIEEVKDPTGAGDTFAGGFIGYLAQSNNINEPTIRQAVVVGSVMASFNVEDFSLNKLRDLTESTIKERCNAFNKFVSFDEINFLCKTL